MDIMYFRPVSPSRFHEAGQYRLGVPSPSDHEAIARCAALGAGETAVRSQPVGPGTIAMPRLCCCH